LPVYTTRAKKFASQWISPFSVVDRIADGRAYLQDLPPHMHLHPTFHVILLKGYVHGNQPSRIRPAKVPELFANGHEWDVSAVESLKSTVFSLMGRMQSTKTDGFPSLIWPILPSWSPSIGLLEAVPTRRPHACGNSGARPEDEPLLK
jgi:hypothetical protein